MAIPEDHLAKFHKMTDAKEMWNAIKSRFGGNDESKKMQKYILKQQFEGFTVSNTDGIHKGYERFQISLIMRNKPGMDSLSFDDLYNNLRVFENDVKGSTASSSNLQNVAFISENTNSTNDVSTAHGVSNTSGHNSKLEHTSSYSLLASQSSCPQLDHEDLDQVDEYDLEEMDLKWQVAMISMRIKKFYKKTGRKLQFDAKEPVGFDKTKVECYNCHKTGHFARECRTKEDNRRRDGWNPGNKDGSRTGKKEESKAMVTVDGESVDWTTHSENNEDYDLLQHSGSNTRNFLFNECKESMLNLVAHQQGQLWYEQKIKFMKIDLDDKTDVLTYHKKLLAKAQKEKDDLEVIVDKWNHSSKNLGKIVNHHMSARDKFGLGYGDYRYSGNLSYENEVFQSVFKSNKGDFENPPLQKTCEMQAVPPPMTGNYLPSGPDIEIDDSQYTYGPEKTQPSESESQTTELDTCNSNISTEPSELVSETSKNSLVKHFEDMRLCRPSKEYLQVWFKPPRDESMSCLTTKGMHTIGEVCARRFRESLRRVTNGAEAFLILTLFILCLDKVSTDHAKLVPLGKVCTAKETLEKNTAKGTKCKLEPLISLTDDLSLLSNMAALESCPKHNMIAYLEKTEGNVEFHEVINFLRRSYIYHALTVSPVVSTTFVEQFWTSAKSKTINNVRHITTNVVGKFVSISEASIRTDLIFDDADGLDSLPNQAIFDAIRLMGNEGDLTKGKHFSGKVTPLFDTMLVQPTQDEGASSERLSDEQPSPSPAPTGEVPNESLPDSSSAQPSEVPFEQQPDPSPRPSPTPIVPDSIPEPTGENLRDHSSNDTSLSGNEDDMTLQNVYDLCISLCQQVSDQAKEIKLLKAKITKLKKQAKPNKDVEDTNRPRPTSTRSTLTLKPLPKIDPKDKGKKKIVEEDETESEDDDIPQIKRLINENFISTGSAKDERLIKKLNEKRGGLSKSEVIKGIPPKRKSKYEDKMKKNDDSDKENDELRLCLKIAQDEEKEVDYDYVLTRSFERGLWEHLMVLFSIPDEQDEFWNSQHEWKLKRQGAFMTLKQAMIQTSLLALPDFQKTFVVETDASGVGIRAVLQQEGHLLGLMFS
ncbi:ribonuclease H-like domain-containing protein [Tanacetum coccineum]